MRIAILCMLVFCLTTFAATAAEPPSAELIEVTRIWDKAPHNAFTDLLRFQDRWYCVFREGQGHVSPDGALRVITSTDGKKWESAALITSKDSDLRDAKIAITPNGQLLLSGAEAMNQPVGYKHQSLTWLSPDGKNWGPANEVADRDFWLWRTTWHKGKAYGFAYGCSQEKGSLRLHTSTDGKKFDTLVKNACDAGYVNETSMVFLDDDTCYCLLRRDGSSNTGFIGVAKPPYTDWQWNDLGVKIGGPHMIRLPDGRFVATVRLYDNKVRTSLCWLDPEKATLTEFLKLPSGGDTSYAGQVWHDNLLWVSYYSSHEGKTNIYLAKVKFENR
jgi:hypothetical protein